MEIAIRRRSIMSMDSPSGYGLWPLVFIYSAVFIIFAFSFIRPKSSRDWRSFGMFSAFMIALFTEMYGFPLTIYLLSGWLSSKYTNMNLYSHDMGHLWQGILGFSGDPHFNFLHILSWVFIGGGIILLSKAWEKLYKAKKNHDLATSGIYSKIRHPQYVAFLIIMLGFLLQWPTIITLFMFPILILMYARLAKIEESEMVKSFGNKYKNYVSQTPAFIPYLKQKEVSKIA
jgi:protein-S-isoprenylcysteine O-methyltransferase Ste14